MRRVRTTSGRLVHFCEDSDQFKALNAQLSAAQEQIKQLTKERDEARFRPMGDNHHNALLCPYCNPRGLKLEQGADCTALSTLQTEGRGG